jgi:hypothetical protein
MEDAAPLVTGPALAFLAVMSVIMLTAPRRFAIIPLFFTTVLMTLAQQFIIAGCHFTFVRILLLVGFVRVLATGEARDFVRTRIDTIFFYWVFASFIVGMILEPTHDQFISRAGFAYNALGIYFLVRCLVKDLDDAVFATRGLVILCVILSGFMIVERVTGRNLFSVFGGVSEFTMVRDGSIRAQGPFGHPILAGTCGATLMPLFVGLWFYGKKLFAIAGVVGSAIVVLASASSGPVMAACYGLLSFCFWPIRYHMRAIRWTLLLAAVGLHLFMTAPVWYLIAHLGSMMGGTGFWRAYLIDQFLTHIDEWWFLGTTYTAHWSPTGHGLPAFPRMTDITNQYVAEGVQGGILKLILFIVIIVNAFRVIGGVVRNTEDYETRDRFMFWAFGCALVSHLVSFISVSYFDQVVVLYFSLLAFVSCWPGRLSEEHLPIENDGADILDSEEQLVSTFHDEGLYSHHARTE